MNNLSDTKVYAKGDYVIYTDPNNMKYRAVVESVSSTGYMLTVSTSKKRTVGMTTIKVEANASALEPLMLTFVHELRANNLVGIK